MSGDDDMQPFDEVSLGEKSIEMRATTMEASQTQTASL